MQQLQESGPDCTEHLEYQFCHPSIVSIAPGPTVQSFDSSNGPFNGSSTSLSSELGTQISIQQDDPTFNKRVFPAQPDIQGGAFSGCKQIEQVEIKEQKEVKDKTPVYVDYFDRFPTQPRQERRQKDNKEEKETTKAVHHPVKEPSQYNVFTVYYVPLPKIKTCDKREETDDTKAAHPHSVFYSPCQQPSPSELSSQAKKTFVKFIEMKGDMGAPVPPVPPSSGQSPEMQFLENLYRFVLGGISGSKVQLATLIFE